jgi:hypothetical protein
MQIPMRLVSGLVATAFVAACATTSVPIKKDGELTIPADYKSWPKFLLAVQRPDAKQVREIYMSPSAKSATPAAGFPDGTTFVMENYAAQANADGTLKTGADGKLVKGDLLRVFVMGKNKGWGQDVAEPLRNGNWVYASYTGSGSRGPEDLNTCRACHAPLTASKDFVYRYDEHFATR